MRFFVALSRPGRSGAVADWNIHVPLLEKPCAQCWHQ
jgi:hypothetical protein